MNYDISYLQARLNSIEMQASKSNSNPNFHNINSATKQILDTYNYVKPNTQQEYTESNTNKYLNYVKLVNTNCSDKFGSFKNQNLTEQTQTGPYMTSIKNNLTEFSTQNAILRPIFPFYQRISLQKSKSYRFRGL